MSKTLLLLASAFAVALFSSCEDGGTDLGKTSYYPSFLWVKAKSIAAEKTLYLDFSPDAKNYSDTYADFHFVDNDGNAISTDIMQVTADGIALNDNVLHVTPFQDSVRLVFKFTPRAIGGNYQGYLRLIDHNLDRLDSQFLVPNQQADAFQWTLSYDKRMNPLALALLWTLVVVATGLALWWCVLRPAAYPHFGRITKNVLVLQNGVTVWQTKIRFRGARQVVLSNKQVRQSLWRTLFVGRTISVVSPLFVTPLTLKPRERDILVLGFGYSTTPNPIPRNGVATITHIGNELSIQMN